MTDAAQRERLAAMAAALRPDWPARSVLTLLEREHAHRAYRDLAVALAWLATDSATTTPGRLSQPGPWWSAALTTGGETVPTVGPGREPRCPDHPEELARACRCCRADALGGVPSPYGAPRPPPGAPRAPQRLERPPWCGGCDKFTRLRPTRSGALERCPRCHPLTQPPATP